MLVPTIAAAGPAILHHDLRIDIEHGTRTYLVRDRITVSGTPGDAADGVPSLTLRPDARIRRLAFDGSAADAQAARSGSTIDVPAGTTRVDITYGGDVDPSQWPWLVWLPGDGWYPDADSHLVRFRLTLAAPENWSSITQGVPADRDGDSTTMWVQDDPQQGIYLVSGPWHAYSQSNGVHRAAVMLIEPDDALSKRYLDVALDHMERYSRALGPYPYHGFTLVENRWQTGWGVPGFTLLGSRVIRLPFIIHTSFPHEILHNWWGNGVFADRSGGNWSEGLTTYLSDYLASERRGEGGQYRLNALISWQDYAARGADFPLSQFEGRHDRATQSVGYGKGMFVFHMLRRELGDDVFMAGLRRVYERFKFRYASFDDIRGTFESECGCELDWFFTQWLNRAGAPALRLDAALPESTEGVHSLSVRISLATGGDWILGVPIRVVDTAGKTYARRVRLAGDAATVGFVLDAPAARVDVDPHFDLFRALDESEKPTTFSALFSSAQVDVPQPMPAFTDFQRRLGAEDAKWLTVSADGTGSPAVLLAGWQHPLARAWFGAGRPGSYRIVDEGVAIGGETYPVDGSTVVAIADKLSIEGESKAVLWLATRRPEGLLDLVRRLPRYGRFSYAVFESPRHRASVTGQWRPSSASLTRVFRTGTPVVPQPRSEALF